MIYLVLAIISSMLVSVMMRISGKYTGDSLGKLAVNYVMCSALAFAFSGGVDIFPAGDGLRITLLLGVINGFLYLAGFVMLQWNISRNGVVLPSTFMKLGVIVPTLMAILLFGEKPRLTQLAGMVMAVAAIFVIQGKGEKRSGGISIAGLLLLMLTGGSADAMSKVFEEVGSSSMKEQFLLYTFGVALLLCLIYCVVKKERIGWKDAVFGLLIGIPNYFSARFLLLALNDGVPAMIVYPSFSVGTIVLVALCGVMLFGEKLNRRKLTGLLMILGALVFLNV